MRRPLAVLTALALAVTLAACGGDGGSESSETSPGDVALMYVDAFRGDPEALKEYNPKSTFDDTYFESFGTGAAESFKVTWTQEQADRITAAYAEALTQIEAEVVEEDVDGDDATVTLAITGIGFDAAIEAQGKGFVRDDKDPAASYADLLVKALGAVETVADTQEVELTFTDVEGVWTPLGAGGSALVDAMVR